MMSQENWDNPYAGGIEAANTLENQPTGVPHTLGILNIVFGVVLLLCLSCYGMQILVYGVLGSTFVANQHRLEEAMNEERQKEMDELEEAADNAATDEDAESFRAKRDALSNSPSPKIPDVTNMMGMKTPGVLLTYLFDCSTGIILNVLMLISGIGLLKYRDWARKLALWVAGSKVLRLLIVCLLTVFLIAPALSEGLGQFVGDAAKMNPQGPPPRQMQVEQVKTVYAWSTIVWGIVLLVIGSIYPLMSLWLLSRPNVAAACQKKPASPTTF